MILIKFRSIIANIISAIGLLFPIFSISFVEQSASIASQWGGNYYNIDGSLSPLGIFSFFDGWTKVLTGLGGNLILLSIVFIIFGILEIVSAIFFIRSIIFVNRHPDISEDYSKKSISLLIAIYIIGILTVFVFNGALSAATESTDIFTSFALNQFVMDFPVAALLFLGLSIGAIVYINHAPSYTYKTNYNASKNNNSSWTCPKCNTENSYHTTHCVECNTKRNITTTASETVDDRKWYCPNCGKENSKILSECCACGKAKPPMIRKPVATKISTNNDVASNTSAQNQSTDSTDSFEKIKQLKELFDMGAINQEEFDAKKKEILKL